MTMHAGAIGMKWEITEAKPELRWQPRFTAGPGLISGTAQVVKILQQAFQITEYEGEEAVSRRTEWRDVPDAQEE